MTTYRPSVPSVAPRARRTAAALSACLVGLTVLAGPAAMAGAAPGDSPRPTMPALTTERRDESTKTSSFPVVPVAAGAAAAAAGATAGWWLLRHRRHGSGVAASHQTNASSFAAPASAPTCPSASSAPATGLPLAPPAPAVPDARIGLLVNELIDLRDRLTSEAIRTEIASVLERVGVSEVLVAPGTRFDPVQHLGVDTTVATDPTWDHLVATTEAPGYRTGTQLLRRPSVVVYRFES